MATARLHYVLAAIAVVIAICAPVLVWRISDVLRLADTDGPVQPSGRQDANVSLNHVFVVLDSATYQGILESDFLREEFASFEQRTTTAGDGLEWTGLYFYGASTYLEFFAPGAIDSPIGFAGFAYGVDHPAQLDWLEQQWEETLEVPVVSYTQERVRPDGSAVPWFLMRFAERPGQGQRLMTWAMAWHPGYLQDWYGDPGPVGEALTRRQYLARHHRSELILSDVVGMTLALPEEEAGSLRRELEAIGFSLDEREKGWVAERPGLEFRVRIEAGEPATLRALHFRVVPSEARVLEISRLSSLTFDNGNATWSFFGG